MAGRKPKYGRGTRAKNGNKTVMSAGGSKRAMTRKGSYLTRHFAPGAPGKMRDSKGRPTPRAAAAAAWGETVPKNAKDKARLYAKGKRMLKAAKKRK